VNATVGVVVAGGANAIVGFQATSGIGTNWTIWMHNTFFACISSISNFALAYGLSLVCTCEDATSFSLGAFWHTLGLVAQWASVVSLANAAMGSLDFGDGVFAKTSNVAASLQWDAFRAVCASPTRVALAHTRGNAMTVFATLTNRGITKSSCPLAGIGAGASQCRTIAASIHTTRQGDACVAIVAFPSNITCTCIGAFALSMNTGRTTNRSQARVQMIGFIIVAIAPSMIASHISFSITNVTHLVLQVFWFAWMIVDPEGCQS